MPYPRCWSPERVRAVLTTESRQKARDLFLQTHRPFRRIRVDLCKEPVQAGSFITEEQVRDIIQSGRCTDDNRLFFISGEAGSGKSELCQWLDYTVDRTRSLPIHIPRSMTSAAHVVALLRQHLVDTPCSAARQHIPIETQATYTALSAVVVLYEQHHSILTPAAQWERLLTSRLLKEEIAHHLEAASAGQWEHRLIPTIERMSLLCDQAGITVAPDDLPHVWREVRNLLEHALEHTLWRGDVHVILSHMSERVVALGYRPLLLIEDVTAFRVLGDQLLDYLLDLTSGHFDAVIGITTGFEQTQLPGATIAGDLTHIHHRLHGRFVLTDDQGRSYGLDDDVVELVRTYLDAIKGHPEHCTSCAHHAICQHVAGHDLYPFTETALLRAFASLHEEGAPRQTPRLLLEHVLRAVLLAEVPPPMVLDQSPYITPPPTLFRNDEVPDAPLRALLRWYGQVHETSVTLDRHLADLWDIPIPSQVLHNGQVCVSRAYAATSPDMPPMPADWQEELRELQTWLSDGGLYSNRETLKQGIERVLFVFGDPRSLANPHALSLSKADIYYARGDERIPIFLGRDSGDQPVSHTSLKVKITGAPEERGILEELAYLALSKADIAQVCRNVALTLDWAHQQWEAYHAAIRSLIQQHLGGISVEHLVLIAWKMMLALFGVVCDDQLVLPTSNVSDMSYAATTPWSATRHGACYVAGERFAAWYETVRRLVIGMFLLRDTLIDRERYMAVCNQFEATQMIAHCAELPVASLRTLPFRIRPMGQSLYDLLVPIQTYATALVQLDVSHAVETDVCELEAWKSHLACQVTMDIDQFRTHLTTLRWQCGEVGVVWRESWDNTLEYLHKLTLDDVQNLYKQVDALVHDVQDVSSEQSYDLWSYQTFRHTLRPLLDHPYWAAVATLQTIQHEARETARARYKAQGKTLTGTPAYRACLKTIRAIQQELRHE